MKKRYKVPHRRRREKKTDYRARLALLKSGKPRIVIRKSLKHFRAQLVKWNRHGDETISSAYSKELRRYGWKAATGNCPAAYLTGLLLGKRSPSIEVVTDIGLHQSTKGGSLYAALKGCIDAGLQIPIGTGVIPPEERIKGEHIAQWASSCEKETIFSRYFARNLDPVKLPEHFEKTKRKILKE